MKKRIIACSILMASASLFFAACGDDVIDVNQYDGILTADSMKSLECSDENDGQLAFVRDSAKVFACFDGEWQAMTGAKAGDNCSVEKLKKEDGYKVVCGGDSVGVLLSGKDAEPACTAKSTKEGVEVSCGGKSIGVLENGENGKSCSVKDTTEKKGKKRSGLAVSCGGKVSGVIWNGEDGDNGDNCFVDTATSKAGIVNMICGEDTTKLYKAMCDKTPYDPETHFCFQDTVVERCGGHTYDVKNEFCLDDTVFVKCVKMQYREPNEWVDYDPHTQICDGNHSYYAHAEKRFMSCIEEYEYLSEDYIFIKGVYSKDESYDRLKYFCGVDDENRTYKITERCNGQTFNVQYQFCDKGEVIYKCGDSAYDTGIQFCYEENLQDLCGGRSYDLDYQFCYEENLQDLCGGRSYDLDYQFCYEGKVYEKCFGDDYESYDPKTQFCGFTRVLEIAEFCDDGNPVDNHYFECVSDGNGHTMICTKEESSTCGDKL